MKNTCCVPHCESKRSGVKLHRFPKTEKRLKKWIEHLNSACLNKLSSKELSTMFVCHKHFEKRFITSSLRLNQSAYPTLFTHEEMDTGMSTWTTHESSGNHLIDHDYAVTSKRKHNDHTYCFTNAEEEPTLIKTNLYNNTDMQLHLPESVRTPKSTDTRRPYCIKKNFTPRCRQLLSEYQKAKRQLNFSVRARKAMNFTKKGLFEKLTTGLKPLAKKVLWMQVSQSTKQTRGRRFTDDEKLIALAIMKQSPKSYRFLRKIFILPSVRTINKMINTLKVISGINRSIFHAIKTEVNGWAETKKYCTILFDEVALEPGLSYDKHSDGINGFVELDQKTNNFADHALAFMVRGALHKWQQPVSFYFCEGATSALVLKNIISQVVTEVAKTGLIPVALICDQGTAFQSAVNKLKEDTRREQILLNKNTDDTIRLAGHDLCVIYDPPHLIKGLRNNFLNKDILEDGLSSKWNDIVDVYLTDCKHADIRMLHKLNDEHVLPSKIKKMKVKNCTRVMSKTVASALAYTANFSHYTDGKPVSKTTKNTSKTVAFFDKLFDSCNGASLSIKNRGKPLRQAVTKTSEHVKFWRNAISKLEKMRFVDKNNKEIMVPSQKNFITTLKSLIRLWDFFSAKGCKIMRPRYFNSDPIENFFGQVRAYSFRNNDPNCQSFQNIFRSLLITRFINFHSDSFNCEDSSGDQIIKLKNLFNQISEDRVTIPLSSSENQTMSPEEVVNIVEDARRERLSVHSRAYTAGWVVRKCLKKFNCVNCKKSLTQINKSEVHSWISQREYKEFKNKTKLCYPSEHAVRYFSDCIRECKEYLDKKPHEINITAKIINKMSKYSFQFLDCTMHKKALQQYFLAVTIQLSVHNWCSVINKILRGVDVARLAGNLPKMQAKALLKFKKKLKNKKINK